MTDEANVQRFARPENSGFAMTGGGRWSPTVTINVTGCALLIPRSSDQHWQISRDVRASIMLSVLISSILHAGGTRCFGRDEVSIICVSG